MESIKPFACENCIHGYNYNDNCKISTAKDCVRIQRGESMRKLIKHKYHVGDVVGICSDAMYEFEITSCLPNKHYGVRCVKSYTKTIKVGDRYRAKEKQIVCLLRSASRRKPMRCLNSRTK